MEQLYEAAGTSFDEVKDEGASKYPWALPIITFVTKNLNFN